MSDDMFFDDGMGYTPEDDSSLYSMDESTFGQSPDYASAMAGPVCTVGDEGNLGIGDNNTSIQLPNDFEDEAPTDIWENPEGPSSKVSVDLDPDPTVVEPSPFPVSEGGATEAAETGAITSETAEGGVTAGEIMTGAAEAGATAGEVAEGVTAGEVILDALEIGALLL